MEQLHPACISILRKMLNQRIIGGKHLPEVLVLRWLKYLPRREHRAALRDWENCIKEGMVIVKPKPSGRHVFLNQKRLKELEGLIL